MAASTARSTRNSAPPDATRNKILDAAGEVFADFGFHGATIREICARAGVNVALVNYYFGDKLELYTEVLRHSIGSAGQGIIQQALQSTAPPEEALRELIRGMLMRVCQLDRPVWHYRLMVHEFANPTPALAAVIDETMGPIYDRFREVIGVMTGLPPDHDKTRLCAHSVISQVVHYAHGKHVIKRLWPELEMTPERITDVATHIADFSLAYLRAAGQKTARKK